MLLKLLSSRLGQRRHAGRAEEHPAVAELAACGGLDELRRRVSAEIASGLGTRRILIFEPADGGATYRAAWSPDETLAIPDLVLPAGRLVRWLRVNAEPLRVDRDTALYAYWSEGERDFLTQASAAFCVPFVASGRLVAFACAGGDAGVQIPVAESDMRELEIFAGHAAARWDELDRTGRAERAARGLYRSQQLSASGQLAATVSHEVCNPLAAVRSLVQLVRDADLEPAERRRLLDGVVEEVDRIESTLARHLDLSRSHAPLRVEIDAHAMVAEVVAFVRPYARRRGVDVEFYGADPDYECQYCARHATDVLKRLFDQFVANGRIRYAVASAPLPSHPSATLLAKGALCAGYQDRFWEVHDLLFTAQPRTREALLEVTTLGWPAPRVVET